MKTTGESKVDTVFVLVIFSVFALSVLLVLTLGARVYKNMTDITSENQKERTLLSYIWTKVKNGDKSESISVGEFSGLTALCFDEEFSGTPYRTAIYQYNGWLYELFCETELLADKTAGFLPEDGVQVMEIGELKFENVEHGMIKVTAGGLSLLLYPRSGTGDGSIGAAYEEGGIAA
jgi:hypothetical protein